MLVTSVPLNMMEKNVQKKIKLILVCYAHISWRNCDRFSILNFCLLLQVDWKRSKKYVLLFGLGSRLICDLLFLNFFWKNTLFNHYFIFAIFRIKLLVE